MTRPPVPPPFPPIVPRPRRPVWPWIVGCLVLLLVIGIALSADTDSPPSDVVVVAPPAAGQDTGPDGPAAPAAPAAPPDDGIGDGTHIVGIDISPGAYRSPGARHGLFPFCSWSTHSGGSSNSPLLDVGTPGADEPQVVEIAGAVAAFRTIGCEPWRLVS